MIAESVPAHPHAVLRHSQCVAGGSRRCCCCCCCAQEPQTPRARRWRIDRRTRCADAGGQASTAANILLPWSKAQHTPADCERRTDETLATSSLSIVTLKPPSHTSHVTRHTHRQTKRLERTRSSGNLRRLLLLRMRFSVQRRLEAHFTRQRGSFRHLFFLGSSSCSCGCCFSGGSGVCRGLVLVGNASADDDVIVQNVHCS
jgi:hypothetical protein